MQRVKRTCTLGIWVLSDLQQKEKGHSALLATEAIEKVERETETITVRPSAYPKVVMNKNRLQQGSRFLK